MVHDCETVNPVGRLGKTELDIQWSTHTRKRRSDLDIATLMQSCPQFADMARSLCGYLKGWNDVHRAAVGALIYDKHATGEVLFSGSYLRRMSQEAFRDWLTKQATPLLG